jgi:integrase
MFLFKRSNGFYYIGFNEGRKRICKSLNTKSKQEANLLFRKYGLPVNVTLIELRERVFEYAKTLSKKHYSQYQNVFKNLLAYFGNCRIERITKTDLQTFISKRLKPDGGKYSPFSLNIEISVIKKSLSIAEELKWCDNPAKRLKKFKVKSEVKNFSDNEINLFLDALKNSKNINYYYAVVIALNTGLRKSEVANLRWEQIENGRIRVYNKITKEMEYAYFNEEVLHILQQPPKDINGYVFGRVLNIRNLSRTFNYYRDKLGLSKKIRFHSLRHTAITKWVNGLPFHLARELARHKTPAMTLKYAHSTEEQLREAINL